MLIFIQISIRIFKSSNFAKKIKAAIINLVNFILIKLFTMDNWIESKKVEKNLNWLTKKNYNFHYNMIKGRIAETLIQELFLSSDFNIFQYGMENTIPWIMELLHWIKTEVATDIRRMPDLVVHNPDTKSFYFVEVKFRKNWTFSRKDIDKDYPYHNVFFIVVSKKDIKCLNYKELEEGQIITPISDNYLRDRKEFDLNKDIVKHFSEFAIKFFESV